MDEEEYQEYMAATHRFNRGEPEKWPLQEQLMDELGRKVPGCYKTVPAPMSN